MANAITLNEAAKEAADNGETYKAGIIALYAEQSDFLRAMRFEGIAGNAITFDQEGEISTTAFRAIGEGFVANSGTFNKQTEALYIAGGDIEVDRFDWVTQGPQTLDRQTTMKVKALSIGVTDALINGSNATDPSIFDGLAARITETTQKIANGNSSGGDALSLKNLDQLIDSVAGITHLVMSRSLRRKFMAAFRSSTFPNIVMSKDETGQMVLSYGDLPILVGYPPGKNTQLLPYTEANPGGGSAVGTSIYGLNLSEDGVVGIANGGISVRDIGEAQDAPMLKKRIEWYLGLAVYSQFAAGRLYGIKDADIVA